MKIFKKEITYYILYHIKGNSNNKYSLYSTFNVKQSSTLAFRECIEKNCQELHSQNYSDVNIEDISIESIQMINISVSIFGFQIV